MPPLFAFVLGLVLGVILVFNGIEVCLLFRWVEKDMGELAEQEK